MTSLIVFAKFPFLFVWKVFVNLWTAVCSSLTSLFSESRGPREQQGDQQLPHQDQLHCHDKLNVYVWFDGPPDIVLQVAHKHCMLGLFMCIGISLQYVQSKVLILKKSKEVYCKYTQTDRSEYCKRLWPKLENFKVP